MPVATVDTSISTRHELETLEGAYVELRRLTYGEKLAKQDLITSMTLDQENGSKATKAKVDFMQRTSAEFEFSKCVVEHNLTDAAGNPLDFKKKGVLDSLDPRVGDEIADLIREMNDFERTTEGN